MRDRSGVQDAHRVGALRCKGQGALHCSEWLIKQRILNWREHYSLLSQRCMQLTLCQKCNQGLPSVQPPMRCAASGDLFVSVKELEHLLRDHDMEACVTYLWLVGNGGMGYNYSYYYYHSSIPY